MDDPSTLVARAASGDERAWTALVDRYTNLLWAVARGHRLGQADADDVVQTAWLRLVEHLDRLERPDRVGAWLVTTARRECLRVLRRGGREPPVDVDDRLTADVASVPRPEQQAVDGDRDALLRAALGSLGDRCRTLLRVLAADPPPSYEEVSAAMDLPMGSIGPTRGRCLERLRRALAARGITADALDSV